MEFAIENLSPQVQQFIQSELANNKYDSLEELVDSVLGQIAKRVESTPASRKSTMGIFEHLGIHVTEKDIKDMRKEAWKNFPRDVS